MANTNYDILAIGAHPDDVEVGAGGILIRQSDLGSKCGLVVLTKGEMGTGGTAELRAKEIEAAASIMGVDVIGQFDWGDTRLEDSYEHRLELARLIRQTRPKAIICPHPIVGHGRRQSHADHVASGLITINAANLAALKKADLPGEPHLVTRVFHYFLPPGVVPQIVIDITDQHDRWIACLSAHKSQFLNPEKSKNYLEHLSAMARSFGIQARCTYGQGLVPAEPVQVSDLMNLVED